MSGKRRKKFGQDRYLLAERGKRENLQRLRERGGSGQGAMAQGSISSGLLANERRREPAERKKKTHVGAGREKKGGGSIPIGRRRARGVFGHRALLTGRRNPFSQKGNSKRRFLRGREDSNDLQSKLHHLAGGKCRVTRDPLRRKKETSGAGKKEGKSVVF